MPRGDGTGPMGMGPMTGGGFGYCAGYSVPGFANPVRYGMGRGMAWGRGGGPSAMLRTGSGRGLAHRRGRGGFAPPYAGFVPPVAGALPTAMPDEETALKSHLSVLEEQLSAVNARLGEIDDAKTSEQ